jgi:SAM-dependent methyltransferase
LPFADEALDGVVMIHDLEYCHALHEYLAEIDRVLCPAGRVLMIVPARRGRWAHADWTPFGKGAPFSKGQIARYLARYGFDVTQFSSALFMPPVRSLWGLRLGVVWERIARLMCPMFGGVYIVEAVKGSVSGGTPVRIREACKRGLRPALEGAVCTSSD